MKFAVLDTVYQGYVTHLYADGSLRRKPWQAQYDATLSGGFPTLSAWVEPLRAHGHEVIDIWANQMPLQTQWCIENNGAHVMLNRARALELGDGRRVGLEAAPADSTRALHVDIVIEQIRQFKPDVIVSGYLHDFDSEFLEATRPYYKIAVGQHAAALPASDFSKYDAIISSLPNQVEWFIEKGVPSYLVRLAFDTRLSTRIVRRPPRYELMFAGQITSDHAGRAEALLALGRKMELDIFGSGPWDANVLKSTKIRMHPALWGLEMYQTMADSKIVFNRHIDAATRYANNLRLYEVPGSGALLLTDDKENMGDIYAPGVECVTYRTIDECVDKARYYLKNDYAREKIAEAGHRRTLNEHSYFHRVGELLAVVDKHLK